MNPLEPIPMPSHCVLVDVTPANSWPLESAGAVKRLAYVATDSVQALSFVAVQSASHPTQVSHVISRPALFGELAQGVVLELYLRYDLGDGERVQVALAQAGATTYFPPQQIDDTP